MTILEKYLEFKKNNPTTSEIVTFIKNVDIECEKYINCDIDEETRKSLIEFVTHFVYEEEKILEDVLKEFPGGEPRCFKISFDLARKALTENEKNPLIKGLFQIDVSNMDEVIEYIRFVDKMYVDISNNSKGEFPIDKKTELLDFVEVLCNTFSENQIEKINKMDETGPYIFKLVAKFLDIDIDDTKLN